MDSSHYLPTVALITGANSGLGYAIACRLIVEFFNPGIDGYPAVASDPGTLIVCLATRSVEKALSAITGINTFLTSRLSEGARSRLKLAHITIDLSSPRSVIAAATELRNRYRRIHYVFCNAAVVPFVRIDWAIAARQIATNFIEAMTVPRYKVQGVGWLTEVQSHKSHAAEPLPELGAAFAANVFGHYYLLHEIMKTLHASVAVSETPSRIVWVGSIESDPLTFDIDDIQGIKSIRPYESSKTLTDILVLGSYLPEAQEYFRSYITIPMSSNYTAPAESIAPVFLIAHPGIVSTTIVAIPWWQTYAKNVGFWLCRAFGSHWHCIDPFIGANAPVWLALSPHVDLIKGRKWGSACLWGSGEMVLETQVDSDVAAQSAHLWSQMETLRKLWKTTLESQR
ncbi:3-keto-steroid reductase [Orbilia oligospora]|uniref:3-keto-steroid reductase n=1 Tax=Orbilia oligospora TaxID=2813651 RepID=A0A7C8J9A7_ORBOL|nr:3-keto-steroid reductase [Orbilia oligospora]KAF3083223.1 3-keto-steroid reductase [Orbilia oligospora]KAF3096839.1 3-keto-steroid reductase [Orbilia oligospora]KAF3123141.1 3-keto-steroid reductase [Orbilia oligospora]KAF3125528.1 3-keto-steroid reductase [Orbilia oligospora]